MNKQEFLDALYEELEIESVNELTSEMVLADLEEYDSLAVMSIMALVSEHFNVNLSADDFKEIETVADLLTKIKL